jgi:hypothetical protein
MIGSVLVIPLRPALRKLNQGSRLEAGAQRFGIAAPCALEIATRSAESLTSARIWDAGHHAYCVSPRGAHSQ